MAIDTREELIGALHEASEIEHGLLVQYLYAILTMKRRLDEGLTPRQQMLARSWQSSMLRVAREEMAHLGIVSNLLASIGAGPWFDRPNMPLETGYYPFPFDLQPFSDEALYRFLVFELPRGMGLPPKPGEDPRAGALLSAVAPAPDPLEYEFVGELYAKIAAGFQAIPEDELFIGPPEAQMEWRNIGDGIPAITTRARALEAIDFIVEQGEGSSQIVETAHFARFQAIRIEYFDQGGFAASRPVPVNPATRQFPEVSGPVTLIENEQSIFAAETFNAVYGVMLLLLSQSFAMAPGNQAQIALRLALQRASGQIMSVAVRPLGEIVSEMPLADPSAAERAGPCFEVYGDVSASPYPEAQWAILFERFNRSIDACRELGTEIPRAALVAETLGYLRRNLETARRVAS